MKKTLIRSAASDSPTSRKARQVPHDVEAIARQLGIILPAGQYELEIVPPRPPAPKGCEAFVATGNGLCGGDVRYVAIIHGEPRLLCASCAIEMDALRLIADGHVRRLS